MEPVRIVDVPAAEAARLVPLNAVVQNPHADRRPDIFQSAPDPRDVAAYFADLLGSGRHFALVAEAAGAGDLGYALCEVLDTPADALGHARRRGVLHHIAVRPDARRRGVATALIDAAKARFLAAGAGEWTTSVHAWNEASLALMARAGLAVTILRLEGPLSPPPARHPKS
jgi:ribosomal protein S18 acetylase RimI-like enzyme